MSEAPAPLTPEAADPPVEPILLDEDFSLLCDVILPLFLLAMLGALVWFLIDVRAAVAGGPTRLLRMIFLCFQVAVVGIAVITRREGRLNAAPYSLALLAVMGLFGFLFAYGGGAFGGGYGGARPLLAMLTNYVIIAVIWFGGHFLVRQTTLDPTGQELSEAGLLSSDEWARHGAAAAAVRRRPHPGRAVMILSLCAVLAFGLGHKLLAGHPAQRHAFWCMVVFLASALLVLALSALAGLQLYVRLRGTRLPAGVTALWVLLALPLAAGMLLAAHLAPRLEPEPGSLRPRLPAFVREWGRDDRDGIHAPWAEDAPGGQPTGPPLEGREGDPQPPGGEGGRRPGGPAGGGEQGGRGVGQAAGVGGPQGGGPSPGAPAGPPAEASASPASSPPATTPEGGSAPAAPTTSGPPSEPAASGPPPEPGAGGPPPEPGAGGPPPEPAASGPPPESPAGQPSSLAEDRPSSAPQPAAPRITPQRAWEPAVRAVLLAGGAVLLVALVVLLARAAWQRRRRRAAPDRPANAPVVTRNPFLDPFGPRSPFRDRPVADLIVHEYRALQAYAAMLGHPRRPEVTAHAWLASLPPSMLSWRDRIEQLTELYAAVEYTPEALDDSLRDDLRAIWERLMQAVRETRG